MQKFLKAIEQCKLRDIRICLIFLPKNSIQNIYVKEIYTVSSKIEMKNVHSSLH